MHDGALNGLPAAIIIHSSSVTFSNLQFIPVRVMGVTLKIQSGDEKAVRVKGGV